ncbi:MAG: PilZ domain-containing protein [Thermodesulfobacteriota bacterium]
MSNFAIENKLDRRKNFRSDNADRRKHFRLAYPVEDRPTVKIDASTFYAIPGPGGTFEVVDISERGIRFLASGGMVPDLVKGSVSINDNEPIEFTGSVVRTGGSEVCLHIEESIPARLIAREQRRLIIANPSVILR